MDIHRKIAAWLSITIGSLGLCVLTMSFLVLGGIAAVSGMDRTIVAFLATPGLDTLIVLVVFVVIGVFAVAAISAGIYYLRGSKIAKLFLILINLLIVLAFPFGTAIGLYSLWAILRTPANPKAEKKGAIREA